MKRLSQGLTLIELIITIVIIGVLAAIALPSFAKMIERNRIKDAAESMYSDLLWARSEAIKQSESITTTYTTGANWQYVISSASSGVIKSVPPNSDAVTLTSTTFTSDTISFEPRRGEANSGVATVDTDNYQLNVQIDTGWSIVICNPSPAKAVIGYESC